MELQSRVFNSASNEFPNEVAGCVLALGAGDLVVVPDYGLCSAFTGQLNYFLSI